MRWSRGARWSLVGLTVPAAFLVGRLTSGQGRPLESVERSVYRSAVLTSPFLEAVGEENGDPSLVRARRSIEVYLQGLREADPTLRVSVYARDLDEGPWIGIDDRALYRPSSLTKVVVLVRALQLEEESTGFLDRELTYAGPEKMLGDDTMSGAPDSLRLRTGASYPIRELLRRMIVHSDNHAYQMVAASGAGEGISRTLYDLSAEQFLEDGTLLYDARTAAAVLRSLYHSSFLNRKHSEFALDLLTRSRFRNGMRQSLPPDAVVAAKFGYFEGVRDGRPHHELHECGVVYRPRSPYVTCVMTATERGTPEGLEEILSTVSRILWAR